MADGCTTVHATLIFRLECNISFVFSASYFENKEKMMMTIVAQSCQEQEDRPNQKTLIIEFYPKKKKKSGKK